MAFWKLALLSTFLAGLHVTLADFSGLPRDPGSFSGLAPGTQQTPDTGNGGTNETNAGLPPPLVPGYNCTCANPVAADAMQEAVAYFNKTGNVTNVPSGSQAGPNGGSGCTQVGVNPVLKVIAGPLTISDQLFPPVIFNQEATAGGAFFESFAGSSGNVAWVKLCSSFPPLKANACYAYDGMGQCTESEALQTVSISKMLIVAALSTLMGNCTNPRSNEPGTVLGGTAGVGKGVVNTTAAANTNSIDMWLGLELYPR